MPSVHDSICENSATRTKSVCTFEWIESDRHFPVARRDDDQLVAQMTCCSARSRALIVRRINGVSIAVDVEVRGTLDPLAMSCCNRCCSSELLPVPVFPRIAMCIVRRVFSSVSCRCVA